MRERAVSREFQMGQRDFTLLARPSRPSLPPAPPALKLRTAAAAARDPCRSMLAFFTATRGCLRVECFYNLPNLVAYVTAL